MKRISDEQIQDFRIYLSEEEKAAATMEKYTRDVRAFASWLGGREPDKQTVLAYKRALTEKYAPSSVNSMLSSLNGFFAFNGWHDLRLKNLKIQRQLFASNGKELTKAEYSLLLASAKSRRNQRLYYLMLTMCSTGIRVSEHRFVTVESLKTEQAVISCKGKLRVVILPSQLCGILRGYVEEQKIKSGAVFVSKSGKPLDRSNIWADMKKLCENAGVAREKVFPHNLRHLFARTYYSFQKDVVRLADILGHSSVDTTRIYTVESGKVHREQIQRLGLLQSQ